MPRSSTRSSLSSLTISRTSWRRNNSTRRGSWRNSSMTARPSMASRKPLRGTGSSSPMNFQKSFRMRGRRSRSMHRKKPCRSGLLTRRSRASRVRWSQRVLCIMGRMPVLIRVSSRRWNSYHLIRMPRDAVECSRRMENAAILFSISFNQNLFKKREKNHFSQKLTFRNFSSKPRISKPRANKLSTQPSSSLWSTTTLLRATTPHHQYLSQ